MLKDGSLVNNGSMTKAEFANLNHSAQFA